MKSMANRLKSERGAELIEMALILPLLLLILVGISDFGFLFSRYEVLTNAAREGARLAVLTGYNTADVQTRVCAYLATGGVPTTNCTTGTGNPVIGVSNVTVTLPTPGTAPVPAKQVQLTYTHNFMFIGPIIGLVGGGTWNNAKTMTITAVMRTEN